MDTDRLKLTALDAEDLEIVSAQMQDAVLRVGDLAYLRREKLFALIANRFVWERALTGRAQKTYERRRTRLHFARVLDVKARGLPLNKPAEVLALLAIGFEPGSAPSGAITLEFAGGGALRLEVECIEARLEDPGPAWATAHLPRHDGDGASEARGHRPKR